MTTSRSARVAAAVLAQLVLVAVAVWAPLSARVAGEEILLRVAPFDPLDPFRGAYVDLGYPDLPGQPALDVDVRTEEEVQAEQDARGRAFVPLEQEGEVWVGRAVERARPASGLYLTCDDTGWRLECGIESLFLPQDAATDLEDAVRDGGAVARVRVDGRGHAALLGVEVR